MAKIIQCPNCGDNVEIPTGFVGQVVNCEGCGTGLRLRSRKQRDAGSSYGDAGGAAGGAMSESMSATQIGPDDSADPPSLGTECAVCGATVGDLSELTEDRGRLVCPDCLRRSRKSKAAAGSGGGSGGFSPEPALDATVHHGKMVTVDATFLAATLMAAVVIGTQAWLHYHPKPVGSRVLAAPVEEGPTVLTWEQQNAPKIRQLAAEAEMLKDQQNNRAAVEKYDEMLRLVGDTQIKDRRLADLVDRSRAWRNQLARYLEDVGQPGGPGRLSPGETARMTEAPPAPPPEPTTAPADNDAVAMKPADPRDDGIFGDQSLSRAQAEKTLDAGFAALNSGDWRRAQEVLVNIADPSTRVPADVQELMAMAGMTAAYLGEGNFKDAADMGRRVLRAEPEERSALLNVAMAELARDKDSPLPRGLLEELRKYLAETTTAPDEVAYDVFGTAVARAEAASKNAEAVAPYKRVLESYTARLNDTRRDERKWGAAWLSKSEAEVREQNVKLATQLIEQLEKDEELAYNRLQTAQRLGGDEAKARREWDQKKRELEEARASLAKAKPWLEKFTPVIPDRAVSAKKDA